MKSAHKHINFMVLNAEVAFIDFIRSIFDDVKVTLAETNISNPVLSKLKINIDNRYEI